MSGKGKKQVKKQANKSQISDKKEMTLENTPDLIESTEIPAPVKFLILKEHFEKITSAHSGLLTKPVKKVKSKQASEKKSLEKEKKINLGKLFIENILSYPVDVLEKIFGKTNINNTLSLLTEINKMSKIDQQFLNKLTDQIELLSKGQGKVDIENISGKILNLKELLEKLTNYLSENSEKIKEKSNINNKQELDLLTMSSEIIRIKKMLDNFNNIISQTKTEKNKESKNQETAIEKISKLIDFSKKFDIQKLETVYQFAQLDKVNLQQRYNELINNLNIEKKEYSEQHTVQANENRSIINLIKRRGLFTPPKKNEIENKKNNNIQSGIDTVVLRKINELSDFIVSFNPEKLELISRFSNDENLSLLNKIKEFQSSLTDSKNQKSFIEKFSEISTFFNQIEIEKLKNITEFANEDNSKLLLKIKKLLEITSAENQKLLKTQAKEQKKDIKKRPRSVSTGNMVATILNHPDSDITKLFNLKNIENGLELINKLEESQENIDKYLAFLIDEKRAKLSNVENEEDSSDKKTDDKQNKDMLTMASEIVRIKKMMDDFSNIIKDKNKNKNNETIIEKVAKLSDFYEKFDLNKLNTLYQFAELDKTALQTRYNELLKSTTADKEDNTKIQERSADEIKSLKNYIQRRGLFTSPDRKKNKDTSFPQQKIINSIDTTVLRKIDELSDFIKSFNTDKLELISKFTDDENLSLLNKIKEFQNTLTDSKNQKSFIDKFSEISTFFSQIEVEKLKSISEFTTEDNSKLLQKIKSLLEITSAENQKLLETQVKEQKKEIKKRPRSASTGNIVSTILTHQNPDVTKLFNLKNIENGLELLNKLEESQENVDKYLAFLVDEKRTKSSEDESKEDNSDKKTEDKKTQDMLTMVNEVIRIKKMFENFNNFIIQAGLLNKSASQLKPEVTAIQSNTVRNKLNNYLVKKGIINKTNKINNFLLETGLKKAPERKQESETGSSQSSSNSQIASNSNLNAQIINTNTSGENIIEKISKLSDFIKVIDYKKLEEIHQFANEENKNKLIRLNSFFTALSATDKTKVAEEKKTKNAKEKINALIRHRGILYTPPQKSESDKSKMNGQTTTQDFAQDLVLIEKLNKLFKFTTDCTPEKLVNISNFAENFKTKKLILNITSEDKNLLSKELDITLTEGKVWNEKILGVTSDSDKGSSSSSHKLLGNISSQHKLNSPKVEDKMSLENLKIDPAKIMQVIIDNKKQIYKQLLEVHQNQSRLSYKKP
nr:hypothetical protein 4 [bacterium]